MAVTLTQLLQWIGIPNNTQRSAIIAEMMPDGIGALKGLKPDNIRKTCEGFEELATGASHVRMAHVERLVSLTVWVQDRARLKMPLEFPEGTTKDDFLDEINEAVERMDRRKDQKKIGEALVGQDFTVKLKNQVQWQRWNQELLSVTNSIVSANGSPLSYVIREHDDPEFNERDSWEELAIAAAPVTGATFRQDARTVHKLILQNIHED